MTSSKLNTWMDALQSVWESTTPPNDASRTAYASIDSLDEERGEGRHRQFIFLPPDDVAYESTNHLSAKWSVDVVVFIDRNNRTQRVFAYAVADEITTLHQAWTNVDSNGWTDPAIMCELRGPVTVEYLALDSQKPRSGGLANRLVARVTFPFFVTTGQE